MFEKVIDVGGIAGDESFRSIDTGFGKNLGGAELVARTGDGDGATGGPDALHLELADNGATVAGHIIRNAGDDGVEPCEAIAFVENVRVLFVNSEIAVLIFDDFDFMATLFSFLNEALGGIIGVAVREDCDFH